MKSIYDFYRLTAKDQVDLQGQWIDLKERSYLVVHVDEWTASWGYEAQHNLIGVYQSKQDGLMSLHVFMPSKDDSSFRADFKPSPVIHLSFLLKDIQAWASRSQFKYVNVHALADYCIYLGANHIDWA